MVQQMTDNFWQAEARSEETKKFIKDIKRLTRRTFTAEEKIRIVLEGFRRDTPISDLVAVQPEIPLPAPTLAKTENFERIRQAYLVEGKSIRQIAQEFHHDRRTVRQALGRPYKVLALRLFGRVQPTLAVRLGSWT